MLTIDQSWLSINRIATISSFKTFNHVSWHQVVISRSMGIRRLGHKNKLMSLPVPIQTKPTSQLHRSTHTNSTRAFSNNPSNSNSRVVSSSKHQHLARTTRLQAQLRIHSITTTTITYPRFRILELRYKVPSLQQWARRQCHHTRMNGTSNRSQELFSMTVVTKGATLPPKPSQCLTRVALVSSDPCYTLH